ncbi:hypothetical protein CLOP_g73 [Closterium sp. NIES-67]|nr:hypothetical protein CLOP_g73 [Closterium sp. NIES-67]
MTVARLLQGLERNCTRLTNAEYNSQMENHTWDLVYLPNGKKAIQCKWLAKIKTDEKGGPSLILLKKPPRMTEEWEMRRGMLDSSTMCVTKMTVARLLQGLERNCTRLTKPTEVESF